MNKFTLFLFLILTHKASANELRNITLITPVSYDRPSSFTQTMKSKFQAGAADLFRIDIAKKVKAKIAPFENDLTPYFSNKKELDTFLDQVIGDGINRHLKSVSDDNLITFYKYLGNNLIGKLADKILEKEGVKDQSRRNPWIQKLTSPFNDCVDRSLNSQYDANHCIDALTASLVPSVGVGIVYEMSVSNLNGSLEAKDRPTFNLERVNEYKSCISKTKGLSSDVMGCAVGSMRTGIKKVTDLSLSSTINKTATSQARGTAIKQVVWPTFERCTDRVGANPQVKSDLTAEFTKCIDTLVVETGTKLVEDKISNTSSIKNALGQRATQLSREKSADFKKCAEDQLKKNQRANGMLDISPCENKITNEVTLLVVSETFKKTADDSFKGNTRQATSITAEGTKLLNSCWNNNQTAQKREECLKSSIVKFSQHVATAKLEVAIPKEMPNRNNLKSSSVNTLATCLNSELPRNISEASDLNQRIAKCSGSLTKNVANNVAEYQVRETAKANLSKQEADALINRLVKGTFNTCIGNNPSDEDIEKCGNQLTKGAAVEITSKSFDKEVKAYLEKAGGLNALGLTQRNVDQFVARLTRENTTCINTQSNAAPMDQVNSCVKDSIKKIAFFFGEAQFNKSVGKMYDGRATDKANVERDFKQSLNQCLSSRDDKRYSIDDYTKNLYTCAESVSSTTTRVVALDQVNTSLNEYVKDRPNMDNSAKRNAIRKLVIDNFDKCMKSKPANANQCVDTLKKEATKNIVISYGRIETQEQLNANTIPDELRPVESNFTKCTETNKAGDELAAHLDECTKSFALGFARELGILKLNYLLKQALGSDDFNKSKPLINETISKYEACLEDLKKYSMADGLTSRLSVCTDRLTSRGMNIVRNSISSWMTTEEKDAATNMIKNEFASFLPCLSALIPSSPYTPQLQENIESSVKPLAILLSHYIEYNPENAKETLDGIVKKLSIDLNDVAKTYKAKAELLDFIYENGGLDQFLKAVIRGTVIDGLKEVSDDEVPQEIRNVLLRRDNFEKIFNSPEGAKIKDQVMKDLLRPALLEGQDLRGDNFKNNMEKIKGNVVEVLINAPSFGEEVIKTGIQMQINQMGGFTKFFARSLYGGDSLVWDNVRKTDAGKKAEEYIKEKVLLPKFKGEAVSEAESKKIMEEAKELVTKAVKAHGKTSSPSRKNHTDDLYSGS